MSELLPDPAIVIAHYSDEQSGLHAYVYPLKRGIALCIADVEPDGFVNGVLETRIYPHDQRERAIAAAANFLPAARAEKGPER